MGKVIQISPKIELFITTAARTSIPAYKCAYHENKFVV
jgi:hypothetical protein